MKITRRAAAIGGLSLLGSASLASVGRAEFGKWLEGVGEDLEDFWIATDAYIYGYPWTSRRSTSLRSIRGDRPRAVELSF